MDSIDGNGEGSLNVLQDSNDNHENDNVPGAVLEQPNESFHSTQTTAESLPASSSISMCSASSLLVPGKLYNDISKLKSCYAAILKDIHTTRKNTVTEYESDEQLILLLTNDQLVAGCKSHRMNAGVAKNHLMNLLELVRPVCVPSYLEDTRPKRGPVDNQLSEIITSIQTLTTKNSAQFETLKAELEKCQATITSYEGILSQPPLSTPQNTQLIDIPTDSVLPDISIPHIERSLDNFLSDEECTSLRTELTDLPYAREKGRLTMRFGEHYAYNGSRGESVVEFPPGIKTVLDKLNEQFVDSDVPLLNSCVVNKYVGQASFMPSHSDDERSIHPNSSIFTVSIGKEASVRFVDINSSATHEHVARSGSLYSMSRRSQNCYRHQINKDSSWAGSDVRLSVTFRSVHWRNNNSLIVMGDSNTGGLKFASFG